MANFSDYSTSAGSQPAGAVAGPVGPQTSAYWPLSRLKRAYLEYVGSKRNEILEQQDARRYRHGSQYTSEQTATYNKRKQPVVTYNRIAPKVNGVVGLIEKLRQAPKAYPRTPKEEAGADLATAVVRYVVDEQQFKALSPFCGQDAAIDGLSGIELTLEQGDQGDPEIGLAKVEGDDFFYDPRSYDLDFGDARYMGVAKWLDLEMVIEMFPDKEQEIRDSVESGTDLTTNSDRDNKWFVSDGDAKRVRVIDHWYMMKGEWCYCVYTGSVKLAEGKSYFTDQKGKSFCKFVMFSANVDQDGDRYGFVRQFKSVQDEINQRRSKAMHIMNSRRILAEDGAFDDIEKTRLEAVRPDGVVIRNKGFEAEFDDNSKLQDMESNLKFYQDAKEEMDSYGPTLSNIGEVGTNQSGRAIALQQQAGIAQLGPFMISYKAWKLRVYRAIWNAVRQHWKAERWIRVTDDENAVNFVGLNQVGTNPQTGMPTMVNQVSALDVDIIMEEGPDAINMAQDAWDAMQVLVQNGAEVPPALLVEMSTLDNATKQRWIKQLTAPDPAVEQAKQLELQTAAAKIQDTQAATGLKKAQTIDTLRGEQGGQQGPEEHPAVTAANVENTIADTEYKKAQTMAAMTQAMLAPEKQEQERQKSQHDQKMSEVQTAEAARKSDQDRAAAAQKADADRQVQAQKQAQGEEEKSQRERDTHAMKIDDHRMTMAERKAKLQAAADESGTNKKAEGGLAQAVTALAQNSKESTNAMVKAMDSLAKSADAMKESANIMARAHSDGMAKAHAAPKRIVRDKNGRASHIETVRE
jgi:hypothetical protein